jgi:hypothetical protein
MAYSSWQSYRNRHYSVDDPISQRREIRNNDTDELVSFISKEIVDGMQNNIKLKLMIIEKGDMLTLNPWYEVNRD